MDVRFDFKNGVSREIEKNQRIALCAAMEKARQRLVSLEKIPFDEGKLQGETFVDESLINNNEARLVSNAEYAERLYFRPELRFGTRHNKNAEAYWFEGFVSGQDRDFIEKAYGDTLAGIMK